MLMPCQAPNRSGSSIEATMNQSLRIWRCRRYGTVLRGDRLRRGCEGSFPVFPPHSLVNVPRECDAAARMHDYSCIRMLLTKHSSY